MASSTRRQPAVTVSEELKAPLSQDIELCYQTFGSPDGEPLLLVMGLGGPMNWWDPEFGTALARRGFFVIRYDNRDTGRSSRVRGRVTRSMLVRAFMGRRVRAPYSLEDMAEDACGLLDHLGLESAHVVGVSMGGMIAQTMAITEPQRVRSLTSIMSTTGKRSVGWQHPSLLPSLLMSRGPGREAYIATSTAVWKMIGSPGYPPDAESIANRAGETFDRGADFILFLRCLVAAEGASAFDKAQSHEKFALSHRPGDGDRARAGDVGERGKVDVACKVGFAGMSERRVEGVLVDGLQRVAKAGYQVSIVDDQRGAAAVEQAIGQQLHDRHAGRGHLGDRAQRRIGVAGREQGRINACYAGGEAELARRIEPDEPFPEAVRCLDELADGDSIEELVGRQ